MTEYPKGARWYVIVDSDVSPRIKTRNKKGIKELFFDSPARHARFSPKYVVVQPRGRMKWLLFIRWHNEMPRFVDEANVPDGLIMRAVMLPNG